MRKTEDLKQLKKLLAVAVETAVEVIEKRGPFAFINNAFAFVGLGANLKELGEEVIFIKDKPELINKIINEELKKHPGQEADIIMRTVKSIYAAIIYNVSVGLSIGEDWKQHNSSKNTTA